MVDVAQTCFAGLRLLGADEPFGDKMKRLAGTLRHQFRESAKLHNAITANLRRLGFDI
jgi:hypothetical protein